VHIITAGAYHQRSCIKTERKRNKAKPSDIILYSIFNIHYSFIKITTPKSGRGDPSPTIDEPTHPFSIQGEGLVYHQRSCIKTERKRNKAKPSFTFSEGKYITCSDGTDITRFAETNITARRAISLPAGQ